jgi:hypothetical protein
MKRFYWYYGRGTKKEDRKIDFISLFSILRTKKGKFNLILDRKIIDGIFSFETNHLPVWISEMEL